MTRYQQHSLDEYMRALRRAARDGDRDRLGGGVAPGTLAERVGVSRNAAEKAAATLREHDRVVAVWGVPPDGSRPRKSFLPVGHADAPTDDNEDGEVSV